MQSNRNILNLENVFKDWRVYFEVRKQKISWTDTGFYALSFLSVLKSWFMSFCQIWSRWKFLCYKEGFLIEKSKLLIFHA